MHRELFQRKFMELRKKAEHSLAQGDAHAYISEPIGIKDLQHEVSVQQVELEMQHDELLKTHQDLGVLRIQAEREKSHYLHLFNIVPVGLVVLDIRGVIVRCNQMFAGMVNQGQGQLEGRTLAEFVVPQDRMNFDILCKQEIKHRAGTRIEFHLTDKKNSMTPVHLWITPLNEVGNHEQEYLMTLHKVQT